MASNSIIFLKGNNVVLRPLLKEDLNDTYVQWMNDAEVCKGSQQATVPYTREMADEFYQIVQREQNSRVTLAITEKKEGKFIGVVSLHTINWKSRSAEFTILIGDKSTWNKGYGEETTRLIFDYGFRVLNLNRIGAGTFHTNLGMQGVFKKMKMQKEGVRRQAVYKNGEFLDIFEFGVLKNEFNS